MKMFFYSTIVLFGHKFLTQIYLAYLSEINFSKLIPGVSDNYLL